MKVENTSLVQQFIGNIFSSQVFEKAKESIGWFNKVQEEKPKRQSIPDGEEVSLMKFEDEAGPQSFVSIGLQVVATSTALEKTEEI